jgi:hypothetical protein
MEQEENIMTIGHLAQILDAEYTIAERMKIKKKTIKRLCCAFSIYIGIMILFAIVL